ncbi:MAG: NTP transferase domain-containing protein [Alphaproteobacteria bacterium]|nr:NTP transferase domain-containing protein [Alphaproteobacteria bacterium]
MSDEQPPLAVVAAAGGSTRMGTPKALLDWGGRALVAAHVEALGRRCRVIVVTGAAADAVARAAGATVENPAWATSAMIDSLRVGLAGHQGTAVLQPVDTPPVESDVLDALLAVRDTAIPLDRDGRPGHPVVLSPRDVGRLATATTLRDVLDGAQRVRTRSRLVALGFNDPAEFAAAWRAARSE